MQTKNVWMFQPRLVSALSSACDTGGAPSTAALRKAKAKGNGAPVEDETSGASRKKGNGASAKGKGAPAARDVIEEGGAPVPPKKKVHEAKTKTKAKVIQHEELGSDDGNSLFSDSMSEDGGHDGPGAECSDFS